MVPIIASLAASGLGLLVDFVKKKGTKMAGDYIKEKTGIDIGTEDELTEEKVVALKQFEMEHAEEIMRLTNEGQKIVYAAEAKFDDNLTDRHKADMMSDSWLSKNIRPICLAVLLSSVVIATFLPDVAGFAITAVSVARYEVLVGLLKAVFGYYFIGRSVEKTPQIMAKAKDMLGRLRG